MGPGAGGPCLSALLPSQLSPRPAPLCRGRAFPHAPALPPAAGCSCPLLPQGLKWGRCSPPGPAQMQAGSVHPGLWSWRFLRVPAPPSMVTSLCLVLWGVLVGKSSLLLCGGGKHLLTSVQDLGLNRLHALSPGQTALFTGCKSCGGGWGEGVNAPPLGQTVLLLLTPPQQLTFAPLIGFRL